MKVIFNKLPNSLDDFKKLNEYSLNHSHKTAALFILALCVYTKDSNLGIDMINALKGPVELDAHDRSFLKDRLRDKPYLPFSYFKGSSKNNNYTPDEPFEIEIFDNSKPSDGQYFKVFIQSNGADSKRPMELRKKGDKYYLWSYSSILLSIVPPKSEDPWA